MKNISNVDETFTAKEIKQQPSVWQEIVELINHHKEDIKKFLKEVKTAKIILTGAGSSAFIGKILEPYLTNILNETKFEVEAIDTTNIVASPNDYLKAKTKTLLISFARSGNSPESVATVNLAKQIVDKLYLINITCNKEGKLYQDSQNDDHTLNILLPERTNDKGFAMTSSFSGMLLAGTLIFNLSKLKNSKELIIKISKEAEALFNNQSAAIRKLSNIFFKKVVYLGSGSLLGLAEESCLKFLELTQGKIAVMFNSSLGFRHGPKSIIDQETIVIVFISSNAYTRQYDLDILKELHNEPAASKPQIIAISEEYIAEVENIVNYYFSVINNLAHSNPHDIYNSLNYIIYAQLLALYKSVNLSINPDSPSSSGSVNRVVKGVTIYDL